MTRTIYITMILTASILSGMPSMSDAQSIFAPGRFSADPQTGKTTIQYQQKPQAVLQNNSPEEIALKSSFTGANTGPIWGYDQQSTNQLLNYQKWNAWNSAWSKWSPTVIAPYSPYAPLGPGPVVPPPAPGHSANPMPGPINPSIVPPAPMPLPMQPTGVQRQPMQREPVQ